MKKEDLIEKHPDVLAEIVKDLLNELWNEYLEENKSKNPDFKVVGLKLPHHSELWLNEKTNYFCGIDGKNVIEYEKGLLLGEVFSVKYKGKQFSIEDVVQYEDKVYQIQHFVKEKVHLKLRNGNYYYEPHISEISRLKPLGITEDGFNLYNNDNVSWVYNNSFTDKYEYCYELSVCPIHFEKEGSLDGTFPFKIFKNKDNALKFIEENNKKVLFTTEDNIPIYKNSKFYTVRPDYKITSVYAIEDHKEGFESEDRKWISFSSYDAAEQYVLNYAKVLSFDDIKIYLDTFTEDKTILDIVKERLNQK